MTEPCTPENCPVVEKMDRLCNKIDQFLIIWRYSVPIKLVAILMIILATSLGVGFGAHKGTHALVELVGEFIAEPACAKQ